MSSRSGPSSERDSQAPVNDHDQQGEAADDRQVLPQLVDRRERLRSVDLGDQRPLGAGNRKWPPGGERRDTAIAKDLASALDAGESGPGGLGHNSLMQHRCAVTADSIDVLVQLAATLQLGEVLVGVLVERPRARAHETVGPDEIGLASGAEAVLSPVSVAGHDIVDLLDRQLRDQHGDHDTLVDHRRRHEGGGRTARGRVGREVLETHGRPVGSGGTAGNGGGDIGVPVGANPKRCREIHLLGDRVDQAAGPGSASMRSKKPKAVAAPRRSG